MESWTTMANILSEVKLKRSLSLTDFAKELGISRSSLQEYIHGRGDPRLSTVESLAQRLEINPAALISGEEPANSLPSAAEILADHMQQFHAVSTEIDGLLQVLIRLAEHCPARRMRR